MRNLFRWLAAALLISGCAGGYELSVQPASMAGGSPIEWHLPARIEDHAALARWRAGVGSPLVIEHAGSSAAAASDAITVVSWNIGLDEGDVMGFVGALRARQPARPIVLLLQEAFRAGDDIPERPAGAAFADFLGASSPAREIDALARTLRLSLCYVPSMRNGVPGRDREDRGNAILSSVPLQDLAAIELPFEAQRRVAVAARVGGTTGDGRPWSLRLVNVHLDNFVARRGWLAAEYGRTRQARALQSMLAGTDPVVLAGDFNTWFGFSDQAFVETARAFPQTRITDGRRTFRGILRLDHIFYRLPAGWTADVRRAASSHGSDHHPLVATIAFGGR